jgi:hypothetical protein
VVSGRVKPGPVAVGPEYGAGLAVAVGPIEAEGRAPVMDDEGDPLPHIQGLKQGLPLFSIRASVPGESQQQRCPQPPDS